MMCVSEVLSLRVPLVAKQLLLDPKLIEQVVLVWFQDKSWIQSLAVAEVVEFLQDPAVLAAFVTHEYGLSEPCLTCLSELWSVRAPSVAEALLVDPVLTERVVGAWFDDEDWIHSLSARQLVDFLERASVLDYLLIVFLPEVHTVIRAVFMTLEGVR